MVDEKLHYIQHAYNGTKHSLTETSLFEECLGYLPKPPLYFIIGKDVAMDGNNDIDKANCFLNRFNWCIRWYNNSEAAGTGVHVTLTNT